MNYLSVCSGIEAATVAWHPLGWQPVAFSEIDKFPSAVLAHHYPGVPNWGDMTKFEEWPDADVDVLVGGTPCQSFSVAGLRAGLADPRGNLMLTFGAIARRYRPTFVVWENVPGVLSSHGGRDFGTFLGLLGELGYGFAYRVLDAQYFGVPQRRRRVFVIGHLGDWRRAAAVLFERHSLSGHPAPRREAGEGVARPIAAGSPGSSGYRNDADTADNLIASHDPACTLTARDYKGPLPEADLSTVIAHSLRAELRLQGGDGQIAPQLTTGGGKPGQGMPAVMQSMQVRRLTPRECERLQGFPDDYTLITYRGKPAADGPRYKALGNSMAVPVMRWIGERIQQVAAIRVAA
ncbi:MAG: putative BsuMI modification methylase subunit YdiP [Planctomycetes bacterium]|nr:putative BsuMI modification methylase subunit YdiP [Planctomycetota bacterium]